MVVLSNRRNFRIFTLVNAVMAFAFGLFGPFYFLFISDRGGSIENFGVAVGLLVLSGALASFISGKYSDRCGRKIFLIVGGYASACIVYGYTVVAELWQLYLLQIASGIVISIFETAEASFLGDLTKNGNRGSVVGSYDALAGIAEAIAIFLSSFLVGRFGFDVVFYVVVLLFVVSTSFLFLLKEKERKEERTRGRRSRRSYPLTNSAS